MYGLIEKDAPATQERELQVGDRVRVVKSGWLFDGSFHSADIGSIHTLINTGTRFGVEAHDWYFKPHEIELAPLFTPGTRVRLTRNTHRYAVGDTGTVTVATDENVGVRMNEGRYWSFAPEVLEVVPEPWLVGEWESAPDCSASNGEHSNDNVHTLKLEVDTSALTEALVSIRAFSGPAIVMRLDDGKPAPSYCPHVHDTAASATIEAERLASINPGKQFDVYQRVTGRVAEQHIEMKVA